MDKIIKYDLLTETDSEFEVNKLDVDSSEVVGNFFRIRVFDDKRLVKIEFRDKIGDLIDNIYTPAIIKYKYDIRKKISSIEFLDKNKQQSEDEFGGHCSIQYIYNNEGKILLEIFRNKKYNLINASENYSLNLQGAIRRYLHLKDSIIRYDYDENMKLLKEFKNASLPNIPFIDHE
jgi:hypothetical protein